MSYFPHLGHTRIAKKDQFPFSQLFLNKSHMALLCFWKGTMCVLGYSYEEEVNKSFVSHVTEAFGLSD